jgi:hypothetical protein
VPNQKDQFKEIFGRLKSLEEKSTSPPPGANRLIGSTWVWVRRNKLLSTLFTGLLVAGFSYWLQHRNDGFNRDVNERIATYLSAKGGINDQLTGIQTTVTASESSLKTLTPFIQDVIRHQFESVSKLSASVLQERLPALRNLLAVAKNQDVKIEPTISANLSQSLLQIQADAPGLVEASGDLISYRSFSSASWPSSLDLLSCTDRAPEITTLHQKFKVEGIPHELNANLGVYRNCRVTLDSPTEDERLKRVLTGEVPNITFYQCIIVYTGGLIDLPIAWDNRVVDAVGIGKGTISLGISGSTIAFNDCKFELKLSAPSEEARKLTRLLLAQNTGTINLPLTKNN